MKINHYYDVYNRTEPAIIYLAKPGKRILCALGGIDTSSVSLSLNTNNTAELSFTVDKYVDEMVSDGYEELDEFMELFCDGIWFKIVDPPNITNDGMQETKEITAESYEIMLTQYHLNEFKINMGEEGSYEMMYQKKHDTSKFYQVKFYDPDNEDLSFLHIVLKHGDVPGWKIGYVDNITPDDDGVLLPNSICNFDVDDKSVYSFLTQEASQAYKCIFEFDTVNLLINVYRPASLGKDTNVVLGFRNIQDDVTISRDNSLVTQFYVEGLEEYYIDAANYGTNVIEDLTYFCKEPYMDATLQEKYKAWQEYREAHRDEYCNLSKEYNKNLEVLTELMNRVPVDSAQTSWFGKKVDDLKEAYDANMAIIKGLEAIHVDEEGNFDLNDLKSSSDWPMYESIMNYTLPSIVAALQAQDETVTGYGKGNTMSCINPVVLDESWFLTGSAQFTTVQIDNAPAWGITRGVRVSGNGGIYQHNISIEPSQRYTLSCFVKGSGTFYLGYNNTGEERKTVSYQITSSWQRVFTSFNLNSHLIDVSFTGDSEFTACGFQLEMGDSPTQFGYFTQSESTMKAYETDWKLYGIAELKTKIATYDGCIKELKKNGYAGTYNPLSDYQEAYFTQMHQKYLDYQNLKSQAEAALAERQAEYDAAKKPEIQEKRNQLAKDVLIENFGKVQDKLPGFTDKELYIIKSLYSQATYTNENIIVTTLDSTVDAVDKSITLYKDALEELYVESHPQYTYTDTVDNIYALPEFKEYHKQLSVNDFVRLGLSDTRYVKLRVINITYNPCDLDESMELTFSNVITYKSKKDDFTNLLNDTANTADRNGGRVSSVNKSTTTDYVITADVIKQIFSNPIFNTMMGGTSAGGAGSGGNINAQTIVAELVKAKEGVFDKLTADTAFIKYLDANLISADTIATRVLNAKQANIEKLSAKIIESNQINADMINVKNLLAGNAGVGNLQAVHLTAQNVTIDQAVITNLIAKKMTVADLNTHTATADEFMIISSGKAGIAFKNSTQQFYDSTGAVRVQIGQDGTGKFNFVVKNGDKAALFDENGITQTGIPDNTIINNMITNGTIGKEKLSFTFVEPNEQGGIDISQVYLDGKQFGQQYTSFKDQTTEQITNITDPKKGQIVQSIQNSLFNKDGSSIYTKYTEYKQTVDGITQTVSNNKLDTDKKLDAASTSITQTANKLNLIATGGTGESKLELTPDFINLVSSKVVGIKADQINIDGVITAINTNGTAGKTQIDAGAISTENVNALLIRTGELKSKNYKDPSNTSPLYSQAGTLIDMENGAITSKNFSIDASGNAHFKGDGEFGGKISANSGYIGGEKGFVIEAGKLYSGLKDFPAKQPSSISANKNVYVGTNGIALGDGNFMVDSNGKLYASQGEFTGKITADSGTIGGWTITANSLSNRDGTMSISPDGLQLGKQLNIDSKGNATFGGKLSAATGSFTGEINATSLTLSGCKIDYNTDIENKPDIPSDLTLYIKQDGTIGKLTEEVQNIPAGTKGFKVSSDGLLQASNAVIYGTIYASAGTFSGIVDATELSAKKSYYLYDNYLSDKMQIIWTNSNQYYWDPSSGYSGFEIGIPKSLGRNGIVFTSQKRPDDTYQSCLLETRNGIDGSLGDICYSSVDTTIIKSDDSVTSTFVRFMTSNNNRLGEITFSIASDNYPCFIPGYTNIEDNSKVKLGTQNHKWYQVYTNNLYADGSVRFGGISEATTYTKYLVMDNNGNLGWRTGNSGGGTSGEIGQDYTGGTGITVSNGKISMTGTVKGSNRVVADPINGSFHITINHGWNFVDENNVEVTGSYYNGTTVIFSAHDKPALYRGKSIQIGDGSTRSIKMPVVYGTTGSGTKYVTIDANGTLGATSNGGSGGNDYVTSVSVSDNTVYYTKNGSTHNAGSISSSGSGTTYSAGTGITIYNGTISVTSGTYAAYDHIHRGINNSAGYGLWTNGQSGAKACVYGASNSSGGTSNATVNLGFQGGAFNAVHYTTLNKGSDRNIKECIAPYDDNIEKAYMEFKPVSYKYKTTNSIRIHDRIHYGFIAQDVESAIHKYGIDNEHAGFLQISKLNPDNEWGLDKLYSLAYDEFIALNTHMTQKAHHRIDSLESQLTDALSVIESLKKEIETLKQAME